MRRGFESHSSQPAPFGGKIFFFEVFPVLVDGWLHTLPLTEDKQYFHRPMAVRGEFVLIEIIYYEQLDSPPWAAGFGSLVTSLRCQFQPQA